MLKRFGSLLVAAVMICSLFICTPVALANDDVVSGSEKFVVDDTQNTNDAWGIVASSASPKEFNWSKLPHYTDSADSNTWDNTYCLASKNDNNRDYYVITGGVEADKEIKSFKIYVQKASNQTIYASNTLNGDYTELAYVSAEVDKTASEKYNKNGYAPNTVLTYGLDGKGYRYIKIQINTTTDWQNAFLGKWEYTFGTAITSFEADDTQGTDEAWGIVDSSAPDRKHGFSTWKTGGNKDGKQVNTVNSATKIGDVEYWDYWVVIGDSERLTSSREIKTFEIHSFDTENTKVLASDSLHGEYTELKPISTMESDYYLAKDGNNWSFVPKSLRKYNLSGRGYRYIKIETDGVDGYQKNTLGKWSYTYGDAENTFTADDTKNTDEAWNILASSSAKHGFNDWISTGYYYLATSIKDDDSKRWVVTGGVAADSEIKTFEIRHRDVSDIEKELKIYGSDKLNGEYTEVKHYMKMTDPNPRSGNASFVPKMLYKYDMSGLGYRYIKIENPINDGYAVNGRYTYTYGKIGSGEVDIDSYSANNKVLSLTNGGTKASVKTSDFSSMYLEDGTNYTKGHVLQGTDAVASAAGEYGNIIVTVPKGLIIDSFRFDGIKNAKDNVDDGLKVTVSSDGNSWSEVPAPVKVGGVKFMYSKASDGTLTKADANSYQTWQCNNLPEGTQYIRLSFTSNFYGYTVGKMGYTWHLGDLIKADYTKEADKIQAKIDVRTRTEVSKPMIVLAGYGADGSLKDLKFVSDGDIKAGYERFVLEIKSDNVVKARAYLWNGVDLIPIAAFDPYTVSAVSAE